MSNKKNLIIIALAALVALFILHYVTRKDTSGPTIQKPIAYNPYESLDQIPSGSERRDIIDTYPYYYNPYNYGYYGGGTYTYSYPSYPYSNYPYNQQRNYSPYRSDYYRRDDRYNDGRYQQRRPPYK